MLGTFKGGYGAVCADITHIFSYRFHQWPGPGPPNRPFVAVATHFGSLTKLNHPSTHRYLGWSYGRDPLSMNRLNCILHSYAIFVYKNVPHKKTKVTTNLLSRFYLKPPSSPSHCGRPRSSVWTGAGGTGPPYSAHTMKTHRGLDGIQRSRNVAITKTHEMDEAVRTLQWFKDQCNEISKYKGMTKRNFTTEQIHIFTKNWKFICAYFEAFSI